MLLWRGRKPAGVLGIGDFHPVTMRTPLSAVNGHLGHWMIASRESRARACGANKRVHKPLAEQKAGSNAQMSVPVGHKASQIGLLRNRGSLVLILLGGNVALVV